MLYLNRTPAQVRQLPRKERERMMRQLEALEEFLERYCSDPETGVVRGAYASYQDLGQFEDRLERHLRKLIASRLPADHPAVAGGAGAPVPVAWKD